MAYMRSLCKQSYLRRPNVWPMSERSTPTFHLLVREHQRIPPYIRSSIRSSRSESSSFVSDPCVCLALNEAPARNCNTCVLQLSKVRRMLAVSAHRQFSTNLCQIFVHNRKCLPAMFLARTHAPSEQKHPPHPFCPAPTSALSFRSFFSPVPLVWVLLLLLQVGACECVHAILVWTQERASWREQAGVAADDNARLRHRNSAGRPFAGVAWPWPLKASSPAHPCKQFAVCPSQQPAHPTSPPCCHHRLYRQPPPRPPERSSRAAGAWRSLWTSAPSRQTLSTCRGADGGGINFPNPRVFPGRAARRGTRAAGGPRAGRGIRRRQVVEIAGRSGSGSWRVRWSCWRPTSGASTTPSTPSRSTTSASPLSPARGRRRRPPASARARLVT